jgi:alkylhydroperoxidase family enzyme
LLGRLEKPSFRGKTDFESFSLSADHMEADVLGRIISRGIAREEKRLGVPLGYLRDIARLSSSALVKFGAFARLASHRKVAPSEAYHAARLIATQREDCGTCLQIEVNHALQNGVPAELIRSVLGGDLDRLSPSLADVYRFTEAVVERSEDMGVWVERMKEGFGEEGHMELALAIATCRVFPTLKRGLGHAVSCQRVEIRV